MLTKDQIGNERASPSFPINLTWAGPTGRKFTKKAVVLAISRYGAIVELPHKLAQIQEVTIHCTGKEAVIAQVAGQIRENYERYVYGLTFLDQNVNPWSGKLPTAAETEQSVSRQLLDCESCQTRELVYLDEIQSEVFRANHSLSLRCKRCATWTVWKEAEHEAAVESRPDEVAPQPTNSHPNSGPRTHDERTRFRVQFKRFKACIQRVGFLEEIVRVDDVTRDGFRFVSRKIYDRDAPIEVSIPYSPNALNIFVPAQIIRFRFLPRKKGIEYGVAYAKPQDELPPAPTSAET